MLYLRRFMTFLFLALMIIPAAAGINGPDGQFVYRYKDGEAIIDAAPVVNENSKDITAYYIGAVGYSLSELLPMKAEWQSAAWRVTSGELPAGISFDAATRKFIGTPTAVVSKVRVELTGYDVNNKVVADAEAYFDVYDVQGSPIKVDLYAHTGKFKYDVLTLPSSQVVDKWRSVAAAPPGIDINGRYIQGVPTKAGVYPMLIEGLNYNGDVVAVFMGTYTVQDGPTFDFISDNVGPLPTLEAGSQGRYIDQSAPSVHSVQRAIDPNIPVRYYLEIADGDALPNGVVQNNDPLNLEIQGYANKPYDTVYARLRARDSDDTVGYSNWFTFGTSDPSPRCNPYTPAEINLYTGLKPTRGVPAPWGKQGSTLYKLVNGTMPQGVTLNTSTGKFEGIPEVKDEVQVIGVVVDIINGEHVVSTEECKLKLVVKASQLTIKDTTDPQKMHIRLGETYKGSLEIAGGISPFVTSFKADADFLSFTSATTDEDIISVEGTPDKAGTYSIPVKVTNGDGNTDEASITVYAHEPIEVYDVVDPIEITRQAAGLNHTMITYNPSSVIPDMVTKGVQPKFSISPAEDLPEGIKLNANTGVIYGATSAAPGEYGPFTVTITDYSGDSDTTEPFTITVKSRDKLGVDVQSSPSFISNLAYTQRSSFITVTQPPLAKTNKLEYALLGPDLPDGLTFNVTTGVIDASALLPFDLIGNYGPYKVKVTDKTDLESQSETSADFYISITDMRQPSQKGSIPPLRANVTGNPDLGETEVSVSVDNLRSYIDPDSIFGTVDTVTFKSVSPNLPNGLEFDPETGFISGSPKETFSGNINVNFEDEKGRAGSLLLSIFIDPYPKADLSQPVYNFDLPRLAPVNSLNPKIVGQAVSGFYNAPTWEWDSSSHPPSELSVVSNGAVSGRIVNDPVGTSYSGLRLKAKTTAPNGQVLYAFTPEFTINVTEEVPFSLTYSSDTQTYYMSEDPFNLVSRTASLPSIKGSYVYPLVYSMDVSDAQDMNGITLDPRTGLISGAPTSLGKWKVKIDAIDAEGNRVVEPYTLTILSTLNGDVKVNAQPAVKAFKLRKGEPFSTEPISVSNYVGGVTFNTTPVTLDSTMNFNALTGAFEEGSAFSTSVKNSVLSINVKVDGKDIHDRTLDVPPIYSFAVYPPLQVAIVNKYSEATQYSADPTKQFDINFGAKPTYAMGSITYSVSGDVPGTLVYVVYDDNNVFDHYEIKSGSTTVETTDVKDLPNDALIFDTLNPSLKGTPSKSGTFNIKIVASDDHQENYAASSDTQVEYNTASSPEITLVVNPAEPLVVSNDVSEKTVSAYTEALNINGMVTGHAYGKPVSWSIVSGTLPRGASYTYQDYAIKIAGYAEQTGDFGNIIWKATDAAGRTVSASPVLLHVAPRADFSLEVSENPSGLVVNSPVGGRVVIKPKNAAWGRTIADADWTITGENKLPPGLSLIKDNGVVKLSGTPTVVGKYTDIYVTAKDALGATSTINLYINILSPSDAIILNVSPIVTKINHSYAMQASSDNTYGKVSYYSYDITGDMASQLKLNKDTGKVSGMFTSTGDKSFDLYVTDATNRLTSKTVQVTVLPNLRIIVPDQFNVIQEQPVNQSYGVDYIAGFATNFRAIGNWPEGVTVNPSTGQIEGLVAAQVGVYPDLQIFAEDLFGPYDSERDYGYSNKFSINVQKKLTSPIIANIVDQKYKINTAIANLTPKVMYGSPNDKFILNGSLPIGLSFNKTTGVISGTPTEYGKFPISISVRDINGEGNTTPVFNIFVEPTDAITIANDAAFSVHTGILRDVSLSATNAVGTLQWSLVSKTMAGTVVIDSSASKMSVTSSKAQTATNIVVRVTDELARTATKTFTVDSVTFSATVNNFGIGAGKAYSGTAPAISNAFGAVKYYYSGLPSSFTYDADTGIISSNLVTDTPAIYNVGLIATDTSDNAVATANFKLQVTSDTIKYWRVSVNSAYRSTAMQNSRINIYDMNGNSLTFGKYNTDFTLALGNLYIRQPEVQFNQTGSQQREFCLTSACNTNMNGAVSTMTFTFKNGVSPAKIVANASSGNCSGQSDTYFAVVNSISVFNSTDGVSWNPVNSTVTQTAVQGSNCGSFKTTTIDLNNY